MASPQGQAINPLTGQWNLDGSLYRIKRPNYYYVDSSTIRVAASANNPVYFNINKKFYEVAANLDLVVSALAANTPYYIYAVVGTNGVELRQSTDAPASGLEGYDYGNWSYVGAFCTVKSAATLSEFRSCGGILYGEAPMDQVGAHTATSYSAYTFASLPLTARAMWVEIYSSGTEVANTIITASPTGTTSVGPLSANLMATNIPASNYGWMSVIEAQTIYLRTSNINQGCNSELYGWQEDPTEYP